MSEQRLHEGIASAVELQLLTRCAEALEADLLSSVQGWILSSASSSTSADSQEAPLTMEELLRQDHKVVAARQALRRVRGQCEGALQQLDRLLLGRVG